MPSVFISFHDTAQDKAVGALLLETEGHIETMAVRLEDEETKVEREKLEFGRFYSREELAELGYEPTSGPC